jgi:hypothetical protein
MGDHVAGLLSRYDADASDDPPDDIDVDLTDPDVGWDRMFQDIVRSSATIDEIVGHNGVYLHEDAAGRLRRQRDADHG